MAKYVVTLQIEVSAKNESDAVDFAEAAAQHLMETFNDDESFSNVEWSAKKKEAPARFPANNRKR